MPRKDLTPERSPLGRALVQRLVNKQGLAGLGLPRMRPLLELPAVVARAGSDRYARAAAFEHLLVGVVDDLDQTFFVQRTEYESPTAIARALFQLEPRWAPLDLGERRAKFAKERSTEHFRQSYEIALLEHIARQLEQLPTRAAAVEPSAGAAPKAGDITALYWPALSLYDLLDQALHEIESPRPSSAELLARWVGYVWSYERHDIKNVARPIPDNEDAARAWSALRHAEGAWLVSAFESRERDRLLSEYARGVDPGGVPFLDFLEWNERGRYLSAKWLAWLGGCRCMCGPLDNPEPFASECEVHALLWNCEQLLNQLPQHFEAGWSVRGDELAEYWKDVTPDMLDRLTRDWTNRFTLPAPEDIDKYFPNGLL